MCLHEARIESASQGETAVSSRLSCKEFIAQICRPRVLGLIIAYFPTKTASREVCSAVIHRISILNFSHFSSCGNHRSTANQGESGLVSRELSRKGGSHANGVKCRRDRKGA
jgi:hypothetical protein